MKNVTAFYFRGLVLILCVLSLQACASTGAETLKSGRTDTIAFKVPNPVTTLTVQYVSKKPQTLVPVTIGQPFVKGDVPKGAHIEAITAKGVRLPTQVDWKATNPDGSLRHGIITFILSKAAPMSTTRIGLYIVNHPGKITSGNNPGGASGLTAQVKLKLKTGKVETARLTDTSVQKTARGWLSGPLVQARLMHGPLKTASGRDDPYLSARFYVRHYPTAHRTRIEMIVENDWAFQPKPHAITYDAQLFIDGRQVYSKQGLVNVRHSRWRKVYWVGGAPDVYVTHDLAYLKKTGTIPNYDPSLKVPEATIEKRYKEFLASNHGPMGAAIVTKYMPTTGGRGDIGPLPRWTVLRLISGDPRMILVDDGVAASSGSWPIHLRDKATGRPVSLEMHPKISTHPNILGRKNDPLPVPLKGDDRGSLHPDVSHEPAMAFVPYLLSGDYYYLEELQFWTAWNPLMTSPKYRGYQKGLMKWQQIRGQAWALRTLARTAYITPDDDSMKSYWENQLQNNLEWYDKHYADNPDANKLGFITYNVHYNHGRAIPPWQDDFFTWVMGYITNLGYEKARPMLDYKARFPVGRMVAPGYCWIRGAIYALNVRDSKDSPFYKTFAEAYKNSVSRELFQTPCASAEMAAVLGKNYEPGEMTGYSSSPQGFPSNMQPALAVAVDAGVPGSGKAWQTFAGRSDKPDYSSYPNWDIVPRSKRLQ